MNPSFQFLGLSSQRRALAFEQTATARAINSVIVEKDFWVCWLLGVLFDQPELAPHLVFKGGTSLSKVFGVIDRFSEDVDISVSPSFVGANMQSLAKESSRTSRDKAMTDMQELCAAKAKDIIAPLLENEIRKALNKPAQGHSWLKFELDEQTESPILYFHYPATQSTGLGYIQRTIKLELGSLTDQQPTGQHSITPWVAETFPSVFADWQCQVTALDLARCFWEKATILHTEYHRPQDQPTPDRYARHYSDLTRLLVHPDATIFLADKALAQRVAEWKNRFFARGWARYDLAKHGSFRLVPPVPRQAALKRDYETMRPMFLNDPPDFSDLMAQLGVAEQEMNAL